MKNILSKIKDLLKNNFKLVMGVAVLILAISIFFMAQIKSESLENGNLQKWTASSQEKKIATIQILTEDTQNTELIMQCVDKMSTFEDSAEFAVRDAVKLCNMGIQLRENN